MRNTGNCLVMKQFNKNDSKEVLLGNLKDMFELNQHFINMFDDEEYYCEDENGFVYNSQLEEIFYRHFKENMSLVEIKNLVEDIGKGLVDYNSEEYGNFNIASIEECDKITVAISLDVYFV